MASEEIQKCERVVASLYDIAMASTDGGDERAADMAAGNLLSGSGLLEAAPTMIDLVSQAIEVGYLTALRDIRDGRVDNL